MGLLPFALFGQEPGQVMTGAQFVQLGALLAGDIDGNPITVLGRRRVILRKPKAALQPVDVRQVPGFAAFLNPGVELTQALLALGEAPEGQERLQLATQNQRLIKECAGQFQDRSQLIDGRNCLFKSAV